MENQIISYEVKENNDKPVEEKEIVVTVTEPAYISQKYTITINDLLVKKSLLEQENEANLLAIAEIDRQIEDINKTIDSY